MPLDVAPKAIRTDKWATTMTTPKTLLEMAGAGPVPVSPEDSAVVMIDCQREYLDGGLALPGVDDAIAEGARLLATVVADGAALS